MKRLIILGALFVCGFVRADEVASGSLLSMDKATIESSKSCTLHLPSWSDSRTEVGKLYCNGKLAAQFKGADFALIGSNAYYNIRQVRPIILSNTMELMLSESFELVVGANNLDPASQDDFIFVKK